MTELWRPSATLETLRARAQLLRTIREFFHTRGVLEVDTPMLSQYGTVDRHIDSFPVASPHPSPLTPHVLWLHTSPEFAMKRLLAAGSGPIYQLCHVFRAEQAGRFHNPEFMLLEWYRPGWDHHRLMDEVEALVGLFLSPLPAREGWSFERISYRAAFLAHTGLDPFSASIEHLRSGLARHGVAAPEHPESEAQDDRDFWLDLWMGSVVGPRLGIEAPCFVFDFPASQCALARVRDGDPPLAERFELFWKGIELANGFHELTDAAEQRRRFESDSAWRRERGLATPPVDENLLAALAVGMPAGAGVALGVDRLLMLMLGLPEISVAIPFGRSWDYRPK